MAVLSLVIVLIPLVIIHELGHFFAAKSVGITVLEFGIGFPPKAITLFTRGETEYTLNWLPIGGFVRPYGEGFAAPKTGDEIQDDLKEFEERQLKLKSGEILENPKSVMEAGPWERIWFMFAGPLANFIAAIVIFIIIGLTGRPVRYEAGVLVSRVDEDKAAGQLGIQEDDYIIAINGEPFEFATEFDTALMTIEETTFTVERDDETFDVVYTPSVSGDVDATRVIILEVTEGSPAEDAGLEENDVFLAVDGEEVFTTDGLIDATKDRNGETVVYTIERSSETLDISITPRRLDPTSDNAKIGVLIAEWNSDIGLATRQAFETRTEKSDGFLMQ